MRGSCLEPPMTPSRPVGGADKAGRRGANGSMTATRGTSRTWPSRQQPKTRTRRSGRRSAPSRWVAARPALVGVAVVAGRRCSRSANGPRLKLCTKLAPWRSRLLVGEVASRASARLAACSRAQAATGTATVTNANCRARRLVLVRMLIPPVVASKSRAGRFRRLARQQVEHDGEHDRGDDREQDHQQASQPAAQWPDLNASRAHIWLLLCRRAIGCCAGCRAA